MVKMTAVIKDNKGKNGNSSRETRTDEAASGGEVKAEPRKTMKGIERNDDIFLFLLPFLCADIGFLYGIDSVHG
jgi:hypothetical protein